MQDSQLVHYFLWGSPRWARGTSATNTSVGENRDNPESSVQAGNQDDLRRIREISGEK